MIGRMLARAVLRATNDAKQIQEMRLALLDGEERQAVERLQNYGFTSHPLAGAEGLTVSLGGNREHTVCIVMDDRRYRLHLAAGEVAMYTDEGDSIEIKRGGIVVINASGEVRLGGTGATDPLVRKSDLDAFVGAFNGHSHSAVTTATIGLGGVGTVTVSPIASPHTGTASAKVMAE